MSYLGLHDSNDFLKAHGDQALTQPDEGDAPLNATKQSEPAMAGQTGRRHSAMDKIKETLHLKK